MEGEPGSAAQGGAIVETIARCAGARIDAALAPGRAPGVLSRPMRMTLLGMRTAALAALAWGSACGGNVVVDGMPDGSGGAGATSSSAISTGTVAASAVSVGVGGTSVGGSGVGGSTGVTVGGGGFSAVGAGVGGAGGNGSSAVSSSATWMATSGTASASTGAGGGEAWSACVRFCERYEEACGVLAPGGCGTMCDYDLAQAPQCNDLLIPYFDCLTNGRSDCDLVGPRCQRSLDEYDRCANGGGCPGIECAGDPGGACSCKGACRGVVVAAECRTQSSGRTLCSCFVNGEEVASCEDRGRTCELGRRCCGPYFEALR
ncbi:hypothetical protein WMF45_29365 [Sorangium sp. So ce448]|uniref:hypothetical protein n=1 Tax=Sorangium sp. So ce448 TaxID=3133314 RepID=UPI003F5E7EF8